MVSSTVLRRLVLAVVIFLLPALVHAQEAIISGVITDSTGGVLPGVVVTAVHEASGNSFETVTDSAGGYRLSVRIGTYRIRLDLPASPRWSGRACRYRSGSRRSSTCRWRRPLFRNR